MRKFAAAVAVLSFLTNGCAWLGFGDDSEATQTQTVNEEPAPAPETVKEEPAPVKQAAKATQKPAAKSAPVKGAKSEAQIKAELDKMGQKLVGQASRTLLPNQANKEVKKVGNEWVASYVSVDTNNVSTELRPGAAGKYVGFIRYQERMMECRGATKQAALSAPCTQVRTRNINELIRYDGKQWQD